MAGTYFAALLALASALCIAGGDVLQQRAAHGITDRSVGHVALIAKLLRDPRWWWGALLLAASIALQAAALGRGSVLLVQALLMLSLLFALPINARVWRRKVTGGEWIWAGLLTAAVMVIVIVGNPQAGRSGASLGTWVAVVVVLAPLLVACLVVGRIRGGALAAALFAFVSGALWGVFAVLTKEVVARLGDGGWAVARTPEIYACILAAAGGVVWSQAAFQAGPLSASMPTLQVSQPVVAAVLGVVVLGETLHTGRAGMYVLAAAGLAATAAIVKLARVEAVTTRDGVQARRQTSVDQPA
ncbi:DMT family transporter [Mycobacterium terramassiliense]|uniref:Permease of the drug/metabolite transporter (DMT) superfamily n=1 Tax=Mycobacterium terramassiliense TaxID=1841859 RepID=A0A2U3NJ20_9MYCO|nr:DMT family transporter [Mycobacterium terramassiliense]SPM31518.1 Permease of the drug/metabolite transporter (DMT) superfamily [Mycobacterium terramassiliense]